MSEFGVQLINKYNFIISSEDDVNYTLRRSGVIRNSDFHTDGPSGHSSMSINTTGFNCPIIFFKTTNSSQRLSQETQSNNILVSKWWNLDIGTLQYYIFDRWNPPERSDYGIQILDSGENVIFDSGWNFLKLRDVIWLDPGFPNHEGDAGGSNWTNVGNVGAGNLAVSMPLCREYIYTGASSWGDFMTECVHITQSGGVFCSILARGPFLDSNSYSGFVQDMRSQVMVADVSNLPTSYNP